VAEERDSDGGSAFVFGFLLGAVMGGLLGILFAPQSGAETRSQLREQALRMRDRSRSLGETGQELLQDAISEGRQAASRAREEMDEWVRKNRQSGGGA